jgi:DNA-nicking Smr family endonuclease
MSNPDEPSEADKALFRQMVGEVTPIKKTKIITFTPPPQPISIKYRPPPPKQFQTTAIEANFLSDTYTHTVTAETPLFYCQSAVSKKQLQQFKRGELHIEGRLDLHGQTIDQARCSLTHFINKHHELNHRVLLLIHGKGKPTGQPILKNLVNHWLPQIPQVLAFVSARPRDGGAGALYILLKRS